MSSCGVIYGFVGSFICPWMTVQTMTFSSLFIKCVNQYIDSKLILFRQINCCLTLFMQKTLFLAYTSTSVPNMRCWLAPQDLLRCRSEQHGDCVNIYAGRTARLLVKLFWNGFKSGTLPLLHMKWLKIMRWCHWQLMGEIHTAHDGKPFCQTLLMSHIINNRVCCYVKRRQKMDVCSLYNVFLWMYLIIDPDFD